MANLLKPVQRLLYGRSIVDSRRIAKIKSENMPSAKRCKHTMHPNLNGSIFFSSLHHIHYTIWHNASSITNFFLARNSVAW